MTAYQELEALFEKISHLNHVEAMIHWDEAVMMPTGGGDARAHAMATLEAIKHELLIDPHIGELIEKAKNEIFENPWQIANLKLIEKKFLNATCLPVDLVRNLSKASTKSEQAWRQFRAENNWNDFKPYLETTLALTRESAQIRAKIFNKSDYDVLIDDYSPEMTQNLIDPLFNSLTKILPNLVHQITEKQKSQSLIVAEGNFSIEKQKQLGIEVMYALGFNFNHGRLDVSHHPFCGGVPQDVRLTTRYNESDFISSLMAVCHETGHARYEQNLPKQWLHQPVGHALGMTIHESQSLIIEMQACRSLEFMKFLSPRIKHYFGDAPAYSPENLFRLYTYVKPSYIRVDADEITYPLHVILRYEIEKQLIGGTITLDDLPELWDEKMQKYLGISTKNNFKNGVMQDLHWPAGAIGYFPAYTLGRIIAAQLYTALESHSPERTPFDLKTVLNTDYRYDQIQKRYFIIESMDTLFQLKNANLIQEIRGAIKSPPQEEDFHTC